LYSNCENLLFKKNKFLRHFYGNNIMNVVLLNSSFITKRKDRIETCSPHLRIGIASIAAYLRASGVQVHIVDPQLHKMSISQLVDTIMSFKAEIIGLSAYTIEIKDAASIVMEIKTKNPGIKTVVGGYHISGLPLETMQEFSSIDIGVIGEGEKAITEFALGKPLNEIAGIIYRNDTNEPVFSNTKATYLTFDELAPPAWDLFDLKSYKKYDDRLPIEPLRRCPFNCIFCFRACGTKSVYKPASQFVEELKKTIQDFGYDSFLFLAGSFPLKRSHCKDICNKIIESELKIKWTASSRVDLIDSQLLGLMKESGCQALQFGVESGDENILNHSSKGITPEKSLQAVKLCKAEGIQTGANFILGLPNETNKTLNKTYQFAVKLFKYCDSINFAILVPYPGTEVYSMALNNRNGFKLLSKNWNDFGKQIGLVLEHPNFTNKELQKIQSKFYLLSYTRYPLKAMKLFSLSRLGLLIKRLILPN
jgi:anaerobic magnesium-protoporphyrin IX monomethyl ester cyclase